MFSSFQRKLTITIVSRYDVISVPWLALNLHQLLSDGAAFTTQSRSSLQATQYRIHTQMRLFCDYERDIACYSLASQKNKNSINTHESCIHYCNTRSYWPQTFNGILLSHFMKCWFVLCFLVVLEQVFMLVCIKIAYFFCYFTLSHLSSRSVLNTWTFTSCFDETPRSENTKLA